MSADSEPPKGEGEDHTPALSLLDISVDYVENHYFQSIVAIPQTSPPIGAPD